MAEENKDMEIENEAHPEGERSYMVEFIDYSKDKTGKTLVNKVKQCCQYHAYKAFVHDRTHVKKNTSFEVLRVHTIH